MTAPRVVRDGTGSDVVSRQRHADAGPVGPVLD
jgi:hypothetical protein